MKAPFTVDRAGLLGEGRLTPQGPRSASRLRRLRPKWPWLGKRGTAAGRRSAPVHGDTPTPGDRDLASHLALILFARTALNSSHRIIYPFLPDIARGLGISLAAASGVVAARTLAGLTAPVFGLLADRAGRRRAMELGLVLFALAGVVLASSGSYVPALVAFALYGLSKVLFDPAVHAYLGDSVPYRRRGRAIGIVEMSWSGAWLIGVPISGLLIEHVGWRAPWLALIGLGLAGLWLTHTRLPAGQPALPMQRPPTRWVAIAGRWRQLLGRRHVLPLLLGSLLLTFANEVPFVVYGAWLEQSFDLGAGLVGLVSIVVGLSEATAEFGATVFTDRLGKRRSVVLGLVLLALSLVVLPFTVELGVVGALGGVAFMMLSFEYAIVSLLPLATEIVPEARGQLMSFNLAAMSLGRLLGAPTGGWLWDVGQAGILPHSIAGAACALGAAILFGRGLAGLSGSAGKEQEGHHLSSGS